MMFNYYLRLRFKRVSSFSTSREQGRVKARYISVTTVQISMVCSVLVISSIPWKHSSWMEITETMDESLIREIN